VKARFARNETWLERAGHNEEVKPAAPFALAVASTLSTALLGCIAGHGGGAVPKAPKTETAAVTVSPPPPPKPERVRRELPLGGREIFPKYRLVGFCGTPGAPALGKLMNKLPARAKELETYAKKYADKRPVQPVFELIAVVVQGIPGPDGMYRRRVPESVIEDYLREARAAKALLVLNVQPGHSDFMTEIKLFEKYLKEPDVGVALDPEWAMKPKQTPGVYYGQTTGAIVNEVGEYLSGFVKEHDLPEKLLIFHQMNKWVLKDEEVIKPTPGVVFIKSVDGQGPSGAKVTTYNFLIRRMTAGVHPGFKLFFDEDTRIGHHLMSPSEVLALAPEPEYVMYE
jgi:hypothetical protein